MSVVDHVAESMRFDPEWQPTRADAYKLASWIERFEPVLRAFIANHEARLEHARRCAESAGEPKTKGQDSPPRPAVRAAYLHMIHTDDVLDNALADAQVEGVESLG